MIVIIPKWMITTSRRQGQIREEMSEGSPSAKLRADEQKSHRRPSSRGESAQDDEAHRFAGQGKCGGCAVTVHVLIWGDLAHLRSVTTAPRLVITRVMSEKSAEGIVIGGHRN